MYERGVYQAGKAASEEITLPAFWIDQYSGKIIHKQERDNRTSGDIFVEWLYPRHTGEAFGLSGRLILNGTRTGCRHFSVFTIRLFVREPTGFVRLLMEPSLHIKPCRFVR